jgi:hypothetical protein
VAIFLESELLHLIHPVNVATFLKRLSELELSVVVVDKYLRKLDLLNFITGQISISVLWGWLN